MEFFNSLFYMHELHTYLKCVCFLWVFDLVDRFSLEIKP